MSIICCKQILPKGGKKWTIDGLPAARAQPLKKGGKKLASIHSVISALTTTSNFRSNSNHGIWWPSHPTSGRAWLAQIWIQSSGLLPLNPAPSPSVLLPRDFSAASPSPCANSTQRLCSIAVALRNPPSFSSIVFCRHAEHSPTQDFHALGTHEVGRQEAVRDSVAATRPERRRLGSLPSFTASEYPIVDHSPFPRPDRRRRVPTAQASRFVSVHPRLSAAAAAAASVRSIFGHLRRRRYSWHPHASEPWDGGSCPHEDCGAEDGAGSRVLAQSHDRVAVHRRRLRGCLRRQLATRRSQKHRLRHAAPNQDDRSVSVADNSTAHRRCRRDYEEGDAEANHGREEPAPHPQPLSGDGSPLPCLTI
jgi:hypothetical protein